MKKFFKLFLMAIMAILLTTQTGKANDTIRIQLPGGIHNICVDPGNLPTFVLYKPNGFGGTVWAINSVYYGTGDSIIYTPITVQSYSFGATWDGNVEGVTYYLYSAPPAHVNFVVLDGGSVNMTNDTLWMCDDSVRVSSNAMGSEMTSWHWGSTAGFYSVDAPVYITAPGTYFYYMENPCGITIDTFEVIQLPTSAPVWTDIAFCNTSVNLSLDAGEGWSYHWTYGTLQVNMSNGSTMVPATSDIVFFDTGGKNGNYSNNENLVHTFTSANGNPLTVLITSLNLESTSMEHLIIYDGPNTSSPELFNATGSVAPSAVTSTGSVITVKFYSDFSITHEGWTALISSNGAGFVSTAQGYTATATGIYTVGLSNACVSSASASIAVTQEFYPMPAFDTIPILCNNLQQIINPNDTFVYDTYLWSTGETTPSITVTAPSATYYVTVTKGGCSAIAGTDMYFYPDPEAPVQCVSTFDPLSGKNATVIEADLSEIELIGYVLCFKQGSSWIPLDTIASGALPSYTLYDNLHDPNQQSFTYAAFALHSCGNLSPLGDWHKTIRIAIFQDVISSDYVLQIMDDYETMGGYTPDSYTIWIDSLNDGNLSEIGILNGGNSSFTISTPVNGAAYYASVNLPWTCNTTKSANVSFSNKRVFSTSSVSENTLQTLTIYPNPATNQITISGVETGGTLRLYDLSGKLLLERENSDNTLELVGIAAGSYVLEVRAGAESGSEVLRGRVVVE